MKRLKQKTRPRHRADPCDRALKNSPRWRSSKLLLDLLQSGGSVRKSWRSSTLLRACVAFCARSDVKARVLSRHVAI